MIEEGVDTRGHVVEHSRGVGEEVVRRQEDGWPRQVVLGGAVYGYQALGMERRPAHEESYYNSDCW